jgi:phenylalanyl-tRNA synthetase beta chain
MKISYNWLKNYLPVDIPAKELADILTNIGLEVEGIENFQSVKGGLEGVVVGEVLSCTKHPDADKLTLTTVDLGDGEPVQIVCGAPNVRAGQKVPVATVGSVLYPDEKEFAIKKTKIRGEISMGMICAEDELGLGPSHEGIMVLDQAAVPGTPCSKYFEIEDDTIFEIGLTPNRIDAASHLGVARDLAAFLGQKEIVRMTKPLVDPFRADNDKLHVEVEIEEPEGCRRYSGVTVSGIKVRPSPKWLQTRLRSIGLTPINNVVDITNFVLHESGQPLHAFDAKVTGSRVIVRTLPEGTRFTTLDGQERTLLGSDLMICNENEGMCIAGVFGGIGSGVTEDTREIFLESACFDPVYIRKTARHHMLNTDASFRFERGSDPNNTVWALKRAALMIREIAGGYISSEIVDVYPEPVEDFEVEILYSNVDRLIGNRLDPDLMQSILESLDIKVKFRNETGMLVHVPPYRVDVQREADVVEEILRIYGFNRVETGLGLRSTLSWTEKPDKEKITNMVSELLAGNGFFEMKSNSLTKASYHDTEDREDPEAVRLFNPLSQDLAHMRKSLVNGGLEAVAWNINRKNPDLKLYEFGYCYRLLPKGQAGTGLLDKFRETFKMAMFLSGKVPPGNWAQPAGNASFPALKRFVETVLIKTGINPVFLETRGGGRPEFSESLEYLDGTETLVEFGRISPSLLEQFDIGQEVYAAEFNWELLLALVRGHRILFRPLPKYPLVTRDFSLLLDRSVTFESLRKQAFETEKKLLKQVTLFDVYEGDKIETGKKSYALSFTLLDEKGTLTDKQIEKTMNSLARDFEKHFGARVRGMNA